MNETVLQMIDIRSPEHVEVHIDSSGTILWVNVDGACRLRIQRINTLTVWDETKGVKDDD